MNNKSIINYFKRQNYVIDPLFCLDCPISKSKLSIILDKNDGIEEFYNLNCIQRMVFLSKRLNIKLALDYNATFCNSLIPAINNLIKFAKLKKVHLKVE
jgi:hypothetical protein